MIPESIVLWITNFNNNGKIKNYCLGIKCVVEVIKKPAKYPEHTILFLDKEKLLRKNNKNIEKVNNFITYRLDCDIVEAQKVCC